MADGIHFKKSKKALEVNGKKHVVIIADPVTTLAELKKAGIGEEMAKRLIDNMPLRTYELYDAESKKHKKSQEFYIPVLIEKEKGKYEVLSVLKAHIGPDKEGHAAVVITEHMTDGLPQRFDEDQVIGGIPGEVKKGVIVPAATYDRNGFSASHADAITGIMEKVLKNEISLKIAKTQYEDSKHVPADIPKGNSLSPTQISVVITELPAVGKTGL